MGNVSPHGYQPKLVVQMPADDPGWTDEMSIELYLKSQGGGALQCCEARCDGWFREADNRGFVLFVLESVGFEESRIRPVAGCSAIGSAEVYDAP